MKYNSFILEWYRDFLKRFFQILRNSEIFRAVMVFLGLLENLEVFRAVIVFSGSLENLGVLPSEPELSRLFY